MSRDTENDGPVGGGDSGSNEAAVRTEWSESRPPSVAVVEAAEEATGRAAADLPMLHASTDPDALDALVTRRRSAPLQITFPYAGTQVSVRHDGRIEVRLE